MNRRRLFTAIAGAALASVVAGVAYATIPGPGNVYSACMLKGVGTIRLIDKSLPATNLMSHCTDKETEVSWNQAGQPGPPGLQGAKGEPGTPGANGTNGADGKDGKDGASVTNAVEPPGVNCASGGSQFTVGFGTPTFACNGKDGKDGINGADGKDGTTSIHGYAVNTLHPPVQISNVGAPPSLVQFMALPAGTFLVSATVTAVNSVPGTPGPVQGRCFVADGLDSVVTLEPPSGPGYASLSTLAVQGVLTRTAPGLVELRCQLLSGIRMQFEAGTIHAIQVDTLN